jgi:hypothetical protein
VAVTWSLQVNKLIMFGIFINYVLKIIGSSPIRSLGYYLNINQAWVGNRKVPSSKGSIKTPWATTKNFLVKLLLNMYGSQLMRDSLLIFLTALMSTFKE